MQLTLWKVLLGAKPPGRTIEQHDITFVVGDTIQDCIPALRACWPVPGVHVDSYMPIRQIERYQVVVVPKGQIPIEVVPGLKLYFINLGGYMPNDPEEYHERLMVAAPDLDSAKQKAREHLFYTSRLQVAGTQPHIDDKYEIDDALEVNELLRGEYSVVLTHLPDAIMQLEPVVNGCFPLDQENPFQQRK